LVAALCFLLSNLSLAAENYHVIEVKEGGSITGKVVFSGETSPRAMFTNPKDPACPRGIPQEHLMVRQTDRAIKTALIILDIKEGKAVPLQKATLDSVKCLFVPRIQWVPKGASLTLKDSDGADHIIHDLIGENNTVFNVELAAQDKPVQRPMVQLGFNKI